MLPHRGCLVSAAQQRGPHAGALRACRVYREMESKPSSPPPLGSLEPLTLRTAIQGAKGDGCFGITRSRRTGPGWCVASQIGGLASGRADLHIINLDASFANGWGDDQGELFIGTIAIEGPL